MPKEPALKPYEALRTIQFIIGVFILLTGLYLLAPWDLIAPESIWSQTSEGYPLYIFVMASIFTVVGALEVTAAIKGYHNKYTRSAQWLTVAVFIFLMLTRIIAIGFLPVIWLYPLVLFGISLVLSLSIRTR